MKNRLEEIRKNCGMNQEELADVLEVSRQICRQKSNDKQTVRRNT